MSGNAPLVSVIMPARNASGYIAEAMRSVIGQHWQNWELIVVDNASTDTTIEQVASLTDPRIILLDEPRLGVSYARNRGLRHVHGDFYCFLDADDILPPGSIQVRLELLLADPGLYFADGATEAFDNTSGKVLWKRTPTYKGWPREDLLSLDPSCFVGNTWMIRRPKGQIPLFREGMSHLEDFQYFLSMASEGRYDHVEEVVLRYRTGHGSAMGDLVGLHEGYRDLVRSMLELDPPPTEADISGAWDKVRLIMAKTYLKKGRILEALRAWSEKRP